MREAGQVVGPRVGLVGPPIVDRSNILCHFGSRDIRLRIVDTSRNFDYLSYILFFDQHDVEAEAEKGSGGLGEAIKQCDEHAIVAHREDPPWR